MIGQVIAGRYEIVKQLGAGGMGAVYQARQLSMDRMVALKLIHPHIASPEVARRFHREMKATSKIEHANTIRVFDFGADERGQLFLAMELVEGRPLSKVLAESGALPLPRIVHIGAQVVRALGAAHAEGIARVAVGATAATIGLYESNSTSASTSPPPSEFWPLTFALATGAFFPAVYYLMHVGSNHARIRALPQ